jgi:hypothetical protein
VIFFEIAAEILRMAAADQLMRRGVGDPDVDRRNTARIKEIIGAIGWPTRSKVGEQAEHMAWLLVQHADLAAEFQKECLALMSVEPATEVCRSHLAYLEDRVRVAEHRPQRFGTQFRVGESGDLESDPIEDPEKLDERRASAGLEPFAVYRDRTRQVAASSQLKRPTRRFVRLRWPFAAKLGGVGDQRVDRLRSVPLFSGCSDKDLSFIASRVDEVDVPAGKTLCKMGESGGDFFIILEGKADVDAERGGGALGPGDFFGEIALIDNGPRTATVRSATPMRMLVLGHAQFRDVLHQNGEIAVKILRAVTQRLRAATPLPTG